MAYNNNETSALYADCKKKRNNGSSFYKILFTAVHKKLKKEMCKILF